MTENRGKRNCKRCGEFHYNFEACPKKEDEGSNKEQIEQSVEEELAPIEPIEEHPEYQVGDLTPVEDLMARISTLENRVNILIVRFDRLVDAVSKSKRTKGI